MQTKTISLMVVLALGAPTMAMSDEMYDDLYVVGGDVTFGAGGLALTDDFDDRFFQFTGGNVYFGNGLGLHAEGTFEAREETGGLFIGGASYNSPRFQLKGLAGTSTQVDDIMPELYLRGEATYRTDPALGIIATAGVTHRDFRNGADEIVFDGAFSKYFPLSDSNALIVQALGSVGESDPGGETSYSGGGAVSFSAYRDYSVGLRVTAGTSAYDSTLGRGDIDNDFIIVQPNASYFLADNFEMFGRLEYGDTDEYDFYGGALGFKVLFSGEDS